MTDDRGEPLLDTDKLRVWSAQSPDDVDQDERTYLTVDWPEEEMFESITRNVTGLLLPLGSAQRHVPVPKEQRGKYVVKVISKRRVSDGKIRMIAKVNLPTMTMIAPVPKGWISQREYHRQVKDFWKRVCQGGAGSAMTLGPSLVTTQEEFKKMRDEAAIQQRIADAREKGG